MVGVVVAAGLVAAARKVTHVISKSAARKAMGLVEIAIPVRGDAIHARGHFDHSLKRPRG